MNNKTNWQDKIGEKFRLRNDKPDSQKYKVIAVNHKDNNQVVFERDDS